MNRILSLILFSFCFLKIATPQSTSNQNWDDRFSLPGLSGSYSDPIFAVAAKDSLVFIGGEFDKISGVTVQNIAMYDGRKWKRMPGYGIDSSALSFSLPRVNALIVKDNFLIVGGNFRYAGGIYADNIAKYNISTGQWSQLGAGLPYQVQSFYLDGDTLYIGLADPASNGLIKYSFSGNSFHSTGGRINGTVYAIEKYGNYLYAGGAFDTAGTSYVKNIARFNGTSWLPMSWGFDVAPPYFGWAEIRAIKGTSDGIYAGGFFNIIEKADTHFATGVSAHNLALFKPDSSKWYPVTGLNFSEGVDGYVYSLKMFNNELHIGGNFLVAGSDSIRRLAKYNAAQGFRAVGGGLAFLTNFNDRYYGIKSMFLDGFNNLVFAGNFVSVGPVNNQSQLLGIGKWDGTSFRGYGNGIAGYNLSSMGVTKETQPRIFVTGENLPYAGDIRLNGFGYWDGFKWNQVKSGNITGLPGMSFGGAGIGHSMVVTDSFIYIGGRFDPSGPVTSTNILRYNYRTNTYSGLGTGVTGIPYAVEQIAVTSNGNVFISGDFTEVGGTPVSFIAKWNGSAWVSIGSPNNRIRSLRANGNKLFVGGEFTAISSVPYKYVAVYDAVANTWSTIGSGAQAGADYIVWDFEFESDNVYMGGEFTKLAGVNVNHIAKFNMSTSTVTPLGNGIPGFYSTVNSMSLMGNLLYVSGYMDTAGTVPVKNIARWNGTRWDSVGSGILSGARDIVNDGKGNVYFSGTFDIVGDSVLSSLFARWQQSDFNSSAATVTLVAPNGGENWLSGSQNSITWTSSNISNIKIELTTNNGSSWSVVSTSTPAASGSFLWTVPASPSAQCKIKVSDASNPSISDISDNTFTISSELCKMFSVNNGWNLVAVPVAASNMGTSVLFPTATSSAYGYNGGYSTFTTLTNSKGYWIKFGSNQSVTICGNPVALNTVQLSQGWNLIGVFDKNIAVSGITTTPSGIITSSFFEYSAGYIIPVTLTYGKGYWVKTSSAGTMTLPEGTVAKNLISATPENSGEILFTDAANNKMKLLLTEDSKTLSFSELPPQPPAGIFDVRFSDGKSATIKGQKSRIDLNSVTFPVKISVRGTSIKVSYDGDNNSEETLADGNTITLTNAKASHINIESVEVPAVFELSQNYPNPFNPGTTIKYQVPANNLVTLKIYDMLGREVETLVNKEQTPGKYSVTWNASKFSSGIYYYELKSGDMKAVSKMMLIK